MMAIKKANLSFKKSKILTKTKCHHMSLPLINKIKILKVAFFQK
jgi:hypothetical protein